jgi:hypothetical protein
VHRHRRRRGEGLTAHDEGVRLSGQSQPRPGGKRSRRNDWRGGRLRLSLRSAALSAAGSADPSFWIPCPGRNLRLHDRDVVRRVGTSAGSCTAGGKGSLVDGADGRSATRRRLARIRSRPDIVSSSYATAPPAGRWPCGDLAPVGFRRLIHAAVGDAPRAPVSTRRAGDSGPSLTSPWGCGDGVRGVKRRQRSRPQHATLRGKW